VADLNLFARYSQCRTCQHHLPVLLTGHAKTSSGASPLQPLTSAFPLLTAMALGEPRPNVEAPQHSKSPTHRAVGESHPYNSNLFARPSEAIHLLTEQSAESALGLNSYRLKLLSNC